MKTLQYDARVLVIDDDPLFRSLMASLLHQAFLVSVASNGSEAYYKALEQPPDAAIIDMQMPGWDGLKTVRAFRGHPFLNQVKIVVLATHADKDGVAEAIRQGADDFVIKSRFSKSELYEKLYQLLPETRSCPSHASPSPVGAGRTSWAVDARTAAAARAVAPLATEPVAPSSRPGAAVATMEPVQRQDFNSKETVSW